MTIPYDKKKGMVLYSAISSPLDRSKRFTLSSPGRPVHSDTVLGFSWKHSSHAAIAQRLFTHISTTVYSQILIYTAEWTEASWSERKCPNFETVTMGFEPGLSRLRVRHSTNWATALHSNLIINQTCLDTEELMFTHGFMHTHVFTVPYIADGKQEVCEVSRWERVRPSPVPTISGRTLQRPRVLGKAGYKESPMMSLCTWRPLGQLAVECCWTLLCVKHN